MSSNKRLRLSDPSSVTSLASTSSSSIPNSFKYDVFLSFRGEDTRKTFVGHLYQALEAKCIETYKDDEKIEQGERINDQLIKSIQESRFFIVVFSKTYASSSWCLDELAKIIECQKKIPEQTAYPVFYDVEPTQVRKQSGAVKEAFAEHEKKEAAGKWRDAMKELADLAGWELKATANGDESKSIQIIVDAIFKKLHSTNSSADGKLVGMETRISKVISSLEIGTEDVRMIGIRGIGGGGKTTLAGAVYDRISTMFEGKSFVENVREVSKPSLSGLKELQKRILEDVLNKKDITVGSVHDGKNMLKATMRRRKILVVLDDVDRIEQLEALADEPDWFKSGSRIIITTRDEQVLRAHGVNFVHDVDLLSSREAIFLFSRYAFRKEIPIQGYEELSGQVVRYADGLPLTVKVLGSFLCGKDELEWVEAIDRLKRIPLKETLEKLELSYISLEDEYKEIFLDIACILKGKAKEDAIRILESCRFHARIGLKVLEQRSLITVDESNRLGMHDHIEEMGKNIVRRSHPEEPNKHSRLWIREEIEDILANDKGTEETRCLTLWLPMGNPIIHWKGFVKMKKLRYLEVNTDVFNLYFPKSESDRQSVGELDESTVYFPNSLKYLKYWDYPFLYLPKTFQANNLVGLEMYNSSTMVQLWEEGEKKILKKLKFLSLFQSKLTTFDFGLTPNIETLSLKCSGNLEELCMPFRCQKLKHIVISKSKLRTFDLGLTPNLETLSLNDCAVFEELHVSAACLNLKFLYLNTLRLRSLDLELIPNLERLELKECHELVEVNAPVMPFSCQNLKHLVISKSKLRTFDLGLTPNLETLSLDNCADFEELLVSAACPNLKFLDLRKSRLRSLDFELIPNLEKLYLEDCYHFVELHMSVACPNLKFLNLSKSRLRSLDPELIPNLEKLYLEDCYHFVELHVSVACPNLKFLNLSNSWLRSLDLELIPNLESLNLANCDRLVEINAPVGCLKKVGYLNLSGGLRFSQFEFGGSFEPKVSRSSATLVLVGESLDLCPLHPNSNLPKLQFRCYYDENLPSSVGNFEKLISFGLCACTDFKKFSNMICSLRCLRKLKVKCDIPEFPEFPKDLGQLECLEELCLCSTKIKHLPDSICMLKHLKSLEVYNGYRVEEREDLLEKLPEDLGQLECLEKLYVCSKKIEYLPDSICMLKCLKWLEVTKCCRLGKLPEDIGRLESLWRLVLSATMVKHLPDSICLLKRLKYLLLDRCAHLEKLPEDLGRLECLKHLDITDTSISHLPQSIYGLKGLLIAAPPELLQLYDFHSEIKTTTKHIPWYKPSAHWQQIQKLG